MTRTEPLAYYLTYECPNCDETNFLGVNLSFLTHKGLPVIPFDDGAQQFFTCSECQTESYTGDLELMTDD